MNPESSRINHVTDTAFWVAHYRALESERGDALFKDPLAGVLTGERGEKISSTMESIGRYAYWTIVLRTRVIDDFIKKYLVGDCQTVINIGAGLDTRPYRLDLPKGTKWIELDFPDTIQFKNEALSKETPKCDLKRIGVDLTNRSERRRIFSELGANEGSAIVLTEGVIPYLSEEMVRELAEDLKAQEKVKYWITEYYSPNVYARYKSPKFKKLFRGSPFQFYPENWFLFFAKSGWAQKEIRYLYDEGEKLGRRFPFPTWASLIKLVVAKKMVEYVRVGAYLVFEKISD